MLFKQRTRLVPSTQVTNSRIDRKSGIDIYTPGERSAQPLK